MPELRPQDKTPNVDLEPRVDRELEELAETIPNARELSGWLAGTSEETASFFASRHIVP